MNDSIAHPSDKPVRRSICCGCGNIRTVSANHSPRGWNGCEADSAERIAEMRRFYPSNEFWRRREPWVRCIEELKCPVCRKVTRHAMVAHRPCDLSEEENGTENLNWQQVYGTIDDICLLTGATVEWEERDAGATVVSGLRQYLDDGRWFLFIRSGFGATVTYNTLTQLYKALLQDDTRWFVTGPDEDDPEVVPSRFLGFGVRREV